MRRCPVCDTYTNVDQCPTCGFDSSRDYEHLPTFAPTMSIAARRKAWLEQQKPQPSAESEQLQTSLEQAIAEKNQAEADKLQAQTMLGREKARSEETERKLFAANISAASAERKLLKAQELLEQERVKPPHKVFADFLKRLWDRYFCMDDRQESLFSFLRRILCWCILILLGGYLLLDQLHWVFLHTPLVFDDSPCAESRGVCRLFPCDMSDRHEWQDMGCLMPRECRICGERAGGTVSHIWCDAEGDGTPVCHLCGAEQLDPWFYRKSDYIDGLQSKVSGPSFTITFPADSELISGDITILDYTGAAVRGYTQEWSENTLSVKFSEAPAEGTYAVNAVADGKLVLVAKEFFGKYDCPIPYSSVTLTNFRASHLLTGLWLNAEDGHLSTLSDRSWKQAPVIPELAELAAQTGSDSEAAPEISAVKHYFINSDKHDDWLITFERSGQYLAAGADSSIYWSDTRNDDCYWLVFTED